MIIYNVPHVMKRSMLQYKTILLPLFMWDMKNFNHQLINFKSYLHSGTSIPLISIFISVLMLSHLTFPFGLHFTIIARVSCDKTYTMILCLYLDLYRLSHFGYHIYNWTGSEKVDLLLLWMVGRDGSILNWKIWIRFPAYPHCVWALRQQGN